MVKELDEGGFDGAVGSGLVVVDLWAPWCMPCKMIAPIVEELSEEYEGRISFYKLNIDEHQGPAAKYQVMSIPTLLIFKEGEVVDKVVGALPKEKIKEKLEAQL
ncbi:MAG: thioredoxin [Candidatus Altiarchaeales archaeon]|nr:thioredoxin [Candidatus Altiarchaeales archaeon]MBD3416842.1 thioredoxin [Candidatus Altiarchaeales archaeon]